MKPALDMTSIPAWATAPTLPPADLTGRTWSIVSFDADGVDEVVEAWTEQLAGRGQDTAVTVHRGCDDATARAAVSADIASALVGWRLMVAGPADACLRLRAYAVRNGVGDDELTIATTDVDTRAVHCAHCRTTTRAAVELEHVVPCSGCGRKLFVYYHVSRHIGAHLGFMVDAEQPGVVAP